MASSPFRSRSSSEVVQLAGIESAVERLSSSRLASSNDATTDRSSLLHTSSYIPAKPTRKRAHTEKRVTLGKGLRSLLKRDSSTESNSPTRSDFFLNDLQKKSLKEIKFDLLITQIQNSQPVWLSGFVNSGGGTLLLRNLTEDNYSDSDKGQFLPCLRCFHALVKHSEEANLGSLLDCEGFNNLVYILVWTRDLFLLSSTCMTLLDISNSLYGHLHLVECLLRTSEQHGYPNPTFPLISALRFLKPRESTSKGVRICSEVVLTLLNSFLMGIQETEERFLCENELLGQGCLPLILEFHVFGNLRGQLDLFEQILTNDRNTIASKTQNKRYNVTNGKIYTIKAKLMSTPQQQDLEVTLLVSSTVQELIEILAVKQEYLGFETHAVGQYGVFVAGEEDQSDFVPVIGRVQLLPDLSLSTYCKENQDFVVTFELLPWDIEIIDTLHDKSLVAVRANPASTIDDIILLLLGITPKDGPLGCELLSRSENDLDSCLAVDADYGIFSGTSQSWLQTSIPIMAVHEIRNREEHELFIAVKVPPLIIRFKEQYFNIEILSIHMTVSIVHDLVASKLGIPEEQKYRYALFLDDGFIVEDEPARGMLEPDIILSDMLEGTELDCFTLSFGTQPHWLQVLISDDSMIDRNEPGSHQVQVLFNRTVLEVIDVICKVTGHNPGNQQLVRLDGTKLLDNQSLEAQQIEEFGEVFLCLRIIEDEMENDVNIWDEYFSKETFQTEIENGEELVTAATLNQLVRKATDEDKYDSNFLETFLATYRSFTTPDMLLTKMMQRYNVPEEVEDQKKRVVQMRVCVVMKRWIATFNDEAETGLFGRINQWIESESAAGTTIMDGIKKAMEKKIAGLGSQQFYFKNKPPIPRIPKDKTLDTLSFDDVDMLEVARQLTSTEFEIFKKISPVEFFGQAWSRPKTQHLCPNLMKLINHFNFISTAVASIIAQESKVKNRAKRYEQLISLAVHLKNMNSFNVLIAVVSGMNNSGINRLKWTKARVSSRSLLIMEDLEKLTSMQQSYKNYRNLITENSEPPLIPYVGVYLQDLTFIEDGNPDYIGDLINFSKRILVRKILAQVKTFQQEAYNFVTVPILRAFLENLPQLDDDRIYKLSLQHEPRNAVQREIE